MEHILTALISTALSAKVFTDVIRREFGLEPGRVTWWRSGVTIDLAYLAIITACGLGVYQIGVKSTLPVAILLRLGVLLNFRILVAANHWFLELFVLVACLRLFEQPIALAAVIQIMTVSMWLYAAFQKVYHGQFCDGSFFYITFQAPTAKKHWPSFVMKVPEIKGYSTVSDITSQTFCRRLAFAAVATEIVVPLAALSVSGTVWSFLLLLLVSLPVGFITGETNFMITNVFLAVSFVVPFDFGALKTVTSDPLVTTIVVWFIVWPPIHAVLTRRLRFSSWKLAGWGMYATHRPTVQFINRTGDLVKPELLGFVPYTALTVCGSCKIKWLREYTRQTFVRWHPSDDVKGFAFRWYAKRGVRYVAIYVILANRPYAEPVSFELSDDTRIADFKAHLSSLSIIPACTS